MPIYAREAATTVRRRSPWLLPKAVYGAIFLAVAVLAYGWKLNNSGRQKPDAPTQASAEVCIHVPNFAFEVAREEIFRHAKPEIREKIQIDGHAADQATQVAISLSDLPLESAVPLVNVVAAAYIQACRDEWKLHLDHACLAAQDKVRQTQRQVLESQIGLELLRDRRIRSLDNVHEAVPQPTTTENPRWTELYRRLTELENHKTHLLLDCTPRHPIVQDITRQIGEVRRQMAAIPPRINMETLATPQANGPPADTPAISEIMAAQQTAEQLSGELQKAQTAEREALAARNEELRIDLVAASMPPPSPPRATTALLGSALATAATSVIGLGMICFAVSAEPSISSVAELQTILPIPVVGVIPATHPSRRQSSAARRRRLVRWGWMVCGLSTLLAFAWFLM